MALPNVFTKETAEELAGRIKALQPDTPAKWGTMNVAQMLAHCNVTYELIYEDKHPKPNFLMKLVLKSLVKKTVTNELPYKHNSQTAPAFLVQGEKDFEAEKKRLLTYVGTTQAHGENYFHNKESHSFGKLDKAEWNNMFYKHLDHHLSQFGV